MDRRPRLSTMRLLPAVLLLLSPAAAGVAVLVWLQLLDPVAGLALVAALGLCFTLLVRSHVAALYDLRAYADRLIAGDAAPPEWRRRGTPALRDIGSAIHRLARDGRDRSDELRRMIELRENVLDSVPDMLLTLDGQRRVVRANLAARKLLGDAILGRELAKVLRYPAVLDAVEEVLDGAEAQSVSLSLPDPIGRDFSVSVQPLANRAPDGTRAVVTLHDVTALRLAERMRGDFVANASHELRTPLATLVGFIETLLGPARDDEEARQRFLVIMQEQARRMSRLVDDLLSLSRIEQNEFVAPTGAVDLQPLAERMAASLELAAARRGSRISVKAEPGLPAVVGDADELSQLLQNLIDNALKYGRPDGTVHVSIARPERLPPSFPRPGQGAVAIAVRDEGEGIAREHLSRLTERFYRVDAARSRAVGGTGLGLAIVKHIVNRHRGTLTIESEIGAGSTFTIYLPAMEAPPVRKGRQSA